MKLISMLFLAVSLIGCSAVGPGERGVRISMGQVQNETLAPGYYLWVPFFRTLTTLNVQIQKSEVKTTAASKDMQDVVTVFALNWHISPESVNTIYSTIGSEDNVLENVISPAISEILKAATAKLTAEEILLKRHDLKAEVDANTKERMKKYNVIVDDINIVNVQFSHDFAQAVEQKQVAEQRAKQASYEAVKAENDATAEINRARGQAEAQKMLRLTLSPELLQLKALEKWNGVLPTMMTSGNAVPFLSLK